MLVRYRKQASLTDLWEFLPHIWHAKPPKYFSRIAESMTGHVPVHIKVLEASTRY